MNLTPTIPSEIPELSPELMTVINYASLGLSALCIIASIILFIVRKKQKKTLTVAYIIFAIGVISLVNPILRLLGVY